MLSSPARYIQPAEPVYQVHPPRPACSGWAVDVAGDARTARRDSARRRGPVRVWFTGFSMWKSSVASSPLPSRASAITTHAAACVYWPPFSRTPGG